MAKAYAGPRETDCAPDVNQISELFEFWFHNAIRGLIEIGWINPSTSAITNFERFELGDETIADRVAAINAVPGQSVYFRPALIRPDIEPGKYVTDADFLSAPGVWADLDDKEAVQGAPKIYSSIRPNAYVITGTSPHTRVQPFWRCDEIIPYAPMVRGMNSTIQKMLKGDPAVVNPTSLMRVGGTIAWPYKPGRVVEMTRFKNKFDDNRAREIPLHSLGHWFPRESTLLIPPSSTIPEGVSVAMVATTDPVPANSTAPSTTPAQPTTADPSIRSPITGLISPRIALENMRAGRNWHNNMISVVAHWIAHGWSDAEILAVAASTTLPGYEYRDTQREFDKAIRGARQKWNRPEPPEQYISETIADAAFRVIWARHINAVVDANDFVEGLLRTGEMSVTYGEPGCGKSFFILDLAFHIATGRPWRGRAVEQGGVIYCALEGGHGIKNRIAALKRHYKMEDVDIPLAILPASINLLDPNADTNKLIEAIKTAAAECGFPIKLVVIDTLSRALAGGNENAPDDMGALVINLDIIRRATDTHINAVHHSGKNKALGARGHSLLLGALDTEIEITRDEGATHSVAKVTKQRELEMGDTFAFSLKTIELGMNRRHKPVTSCVVEAITNTAVTRPFMEPSRPLPDVLGQVWEAIKNVFSTEGLSQSTIPDPGMSVQMCVRRSALLHELIKKSFVHREDDGEGNLTVPNGESKRVNDNLNSLRGKGLIGFNTQLIWRLEVPSK